MKRLFSLILIVIIVVLLVVYPVVESNAALPVLATVTAKQAITAMVISMGLGQLITSVPSMIDDLLPVVNMTDLSIGVRWLSNAETLQVMNASENTLQYVYNYIIETFMAGEYGATEINAKPFDWGRLRDWSSVPQNIKDWYNACTFNNKMLFYDGRHTTKYVIVNMATTAPYVYEDISTTRLYGGHYGYQWYDLPYVDSTSVFTIRNYYYITGNVPFIGSFLSGSNSWGHSTLPANYYWDSGKTADVSTSVWDSRYNTQTGINFQGWEMQNSGKYSMNIPTTYTTVGGVTTRVVNENELVELSPQDIRQSEQTTTVGLVEPNPVPSEEYNPENPVTDPITDPIAEMNPETFLDRLFSKFVDLFILPDTYFTDRFNEIRNEVPMMVFPLQIIDDLESIARLGPYVLDDIRVTAWGGTHTIVDFQGLRDSLPIVQNWVRGVIFILLLFYNYDQVYKLIRGSSYGFSGHVADTAGPKVEMYVDDGHGGYFSKIGAHRNRRYTR